MLYLLASDEVFDEQTDSTSDPPSGIPPLDNRVLDRQTDGSQISCLVRSDVLMEQQQDNTIPSIY